MQALQPQYYTERERASQLTTVWSTYTLLRWKGVHYYPRRSGTVLGRKSTGRGTDVILPSEDMMVPSLPCSSWTVPLPLDRRPSSTLNTTERQRKFLVSAYDTKWVIKDPNCANTITHKTLILIMLMRWIIRYRPSNPNHWQNNPITSHNHQPLKTWYSTTQLQQQLPKYRALMLQIWHYLQSGRVSLPYPRLHSASLLPC